jgi:subtilisin family serine protease
MWAGLRHMDVTNNSYFVDPWFYWCNDGADQQAGKEAVARAVQWSEDQGVISAAAAGNENYDLAHKTTDSGSPDDSTPVTRPINNGCQDIPAELPGVVTVASTTQARAKSSFSSYGQGVIDVAAPGSSILSTVVGGRYGLLSGTSMASPHAAGVLALIKSRHPSADPATLLALLRAEADDVACPIGDARCTGTTDDNAFFGEGIVDAQRAVTW